MPERLVVVGGDAAGMSAASQARRRRDSTDLEIIAFERGDFTSYSACGIPYFVGDVVHDVDRLVSRAPEVFRSDFDIDVRTRHEVLAVDLDRRSVQVRDLDAGAESWVGFDHLMLGLGSTPIRPPIPGADARGIHGVQTLGDGVSLRSRLDDDHGVRRVVVVGGGYIGLEMAEAMVTRGLEVTIVDMAPVPLGILDPDMSELVASALAGLGVRLVMGQPATAFEVGPDGHVVAVVAGAEVVPADLVVLGLGVKPNVGLARDAGITIGPGGGIAVDQRMRASGEGVWAAGDCVDSFHRITRKPVVVALGTHANKQGRTAGINIGGGYATFPGVIGTAVTKVCSLEIARTGLSSREATEAGFELVSVVVDSTTRAGYFPGAAPIKTKLLAERRSGRLLGAQIIGQEGAAKRIDVLATALWHEMTVEAMLNLDLSYAPPFAPVWDPVLIAARKAWEAVEAS
ncbi:MAG TPA: FAD-dependent oxidoreductase [Mycobacteriales bacterium]|nr:FAD-dependent oxidoreductase [Mycobacteriales bacterium]